MVKLWQIPNEHRELRRAIQKNFALISDGFIEEDIGTTTIERDEDRFVTKVIETSNTTTITRKEDNSVDYIDIAYNDQTVRETPVRDEEGNVTHIDREVL